MPLKAFVVKLMQEIPDHLETLEMYAEAIEEDQWKLRFVPDRHKTQEMCNEARCPWSS